MNDNFQRLSAAIAWVRFPLILCVVMLHCYCTVPLPPGDHRLYFALVYPFGLWLGESGVPAFFFISGYLFYLSQKPYRERIRSRLHTLLYPYLLWNSIVLAAYLLLYLLGHPLDIVGRNISQYGLVDYLRAYIDRGDYAQGNNGPVLCTYWYVRNLFVLCLLSPLWRWASRLFGSLFPLALLVWWMSQHHNALLSESVLFFNLGASFALRRADPLALVRRHRRPFLALWATVAAADVLIHALTAFPGAFYLHRMSLVLNIFAFLLLADHVCKGSHQRVSPFLAGSVFWVFATHDHLAIALRRLMMAHFGQTSDLIHVLLYWAAVITVTGLCLFSYAVFRRLAPRFVDFATGSRSQSPGSRSRE